jgi:hypothetical protein
MKRRKLRAAEKPLDDGWQLDLLGGPPVPAQQTPPYAPPCERQKPPL